MKPIRVSLFALAVVAQAPAALAQAPQHPENNDAAAPEVSPNPTQSVASPAQAADIAVTDAHAAPLSPPPPAPAFAQPMPAYGYAPYYPPAGPPGGYATPPPGGGWGTAPPHADAPSASGNKPTETQWYGWQTLSMDGAALALVIAGASGDGDGSLAGIGVLTYVVGAPVMHGINGQVGKGLASAGIRVGAPLAGFMLGAAIGGSGKCDRGGSSDRDYCGYDALEYGAIGGLLAIAGAIAFDAAVLARKDVRVERKPSVGVAWSPTVAVTRERALAGVGGVF